MEHESNQTIPPMSDVLRGNVLKEIEKMPADMDASEAVLKAMKIIAERVKNKEYDLIDPSNRGDIAALSLATLE